jgi:hypothetical protein
MERRQPLLESNNNISKKSGMDITVLNLDFAMQYGELPNPNVNDKATKHLQIANAQKT